VCYIWFITKESLEAVHDDATIVAVRDKERAGLDIVLLNELWMQARPEQAKRVAVRAINRALEGVTGATAVHMCFG
jgi:5-methyltetrahydropteroyltriglutamate--homocysteine methyltransferase